MLSHGQINTDGLTKDKRHEAPENWSGSGLTVQPLTTHCNCFHFKVKISQNAWKSGWKARGIWIFFKTKKLIFSNMNTVMMAAQPSSGLALQKQSRFTTVYTRIYPHCFTYTASVFNVHTMSVCIFGRYNWVQDLWGCADSLSHFKIRHKETSICERTSTRTEGH